MGRKAHGGQLLPLVEEEPSVSRLELDGLAAASTGPAGPVTVGTIGRAWLALVEAVGDAARTDHIVIFRRVG